MKHVKPLSIRHTLALAIALMVMSTILGASGLYSYQSYRNSRQAELIRARAIAEASAVNFAPHLATGGIPQVISMVQNDNHHPEVCLLAVLNTRGRPLAVRGSDSLLNRYLDSLPEGTQSFAATLLIASPAGRPERPVEVNVASVPIRLNGSSELLGYLVTGVRPVAPANLTPGQVWVFFARLVLIGGTGMFIGFWWLKRSVLIPLDLLSRCSVPDDMAAALPTERRDEIGALARALSAMHLDLDNWRQRVATLERTRDEVTSRTRKIMHELQQAKRKIWLDPLTGLGNRRLLDERFGEIFNSQREAGQDLSLVALDVDHFKLLNDTQGHPAGDKLLEFIGELLRQCTRGQDLAIRTGGDEFILILPSVSAKEALTIAERTLLLFAQQTRPLPVEPKPTMSAGIASLAEHRPKTPEALLSLADQALYAAKREGRSRARIYTRLPGTSAAGKPAAELATAR